VSLIIKQLNINVTINNMAIINALWKITWKLYLKVFQIIFCEIKVCYKLLIDISLLSFKYHIIKKFNMCLSYFVYQASKKQLMAWLWSI